MNREYEIMEQYKLSEILKADSKRKGDGLETIFMKSFQELFPSWPVTLKHDGAVHGADFWFCRQDGIQIPNSRTEFKGPTWQHYNAGNDFKVAILLFEDPFKQDILFRWCQRTDILGDPVRMKQADDDIKIAIANYQKSKSISTLRNLMAVLEQKPLPLTSKHYDGHTISKRSREKFEHTLWLRPMADLRAFLGF